MIDMGTRILIVYKMSQDDGQGRPRLARLMRGRFVLVEGLNQTLDSISSLVSGIDGSLFLWLEILRIDRPEPLGGR